MNEKQNVPEAKIAAGYVLAQAYIRTSANHGVAADTQILQDMYVRTYVHE